MTSDTPKTWLKMREVCAHIRVDATTLRDRMRESRASPIKPCWINIGGKKRPSYSFFNIAEVDRWWEEINTWRMAEADAAVARAREAERPNPRARAALNSAATSPVPGVGPNRNRLRELWGKKP